MSDTSELMHVSSGSADVLPPLSSAEIKARVACVYDVMRNVMREDEHYGRIPGAGNKPTLLKPGAEVLMMTFRICPQIQVEDLSGSDEVRYRVTVRGITSTGQFLGDGIGEASSNEDKYRWRSAVCAEEFEATPEDRKRLKWKKSDKGPYLVSQVRTSPADVANTILKMAKKRGLVDMALTVTAASAIFAQDLEELTDDGHEPPHPRPAAQPQQQQTQSEPRKASGGNGKRVVTEPMRKRFFAIYKNAKRTDQEVHDYLMATHGIKSINDITFEIYESCCEWAGASEGASKEG